jgi:hypothetical protein
LVKASIVLVNSNNGERIGTDLENLLLINSFPFLRKSEKSVAKLSLLLVVSKYVSANTYTIQTALERAFVVFQCYFCEALFSELGVSLTFYIPSLLSALLLSLLAAASPFDFPASESHTRARQPPAPPFLVVYKKPSFPFYAPNAHNFKA